MLCFTQHKPLTSQQHFNLTRLVSQDTENGQGEEMVSEDNDNIGVNDDKEIQ